MWDVLETIKSSIVWDFRRALYRASDVSQKQAKFSGIFRGKFTEKWADFRGFLQWKSQNSRKNRPISQEKSPNSQKNQPILRDFSGQKSNFKGFSRANSKKNRPILQEIWGGGNFAKKQSVKNSWFRWIFLANFAKINQFCVDMTSVV